MDIAYHENFSITLFGYSGVAIHQNWADTGMGLMNKMWNNIKAMEVKNKGINYWVYEPGDLMFSGIELEDKLEVLSDFEKKIIFIPRYAFCKHLGPYYKIPETFKNLQEELTLAGVKTQLPYIEKYGHWQEDESKLETELIWQIQ